MGLKRPPPSHDNRAPFNTPRTFIDMIESLIIFNRHESEEGETLEVEEMT